MKIWQSSDKNNFAQYFVYNWNERAQLAGIFFTPLAYDFHLRPLSPPPPPGYASAYEQFTQIR